MLSDARRRNLERLLRPERIAVVGGRVAAEVIRQCRKLGFAGPIHAVNPKRDTLADVPCLPRIEDLPEAPDAVFLGVGREATVEAVERLAAIGAGGAVAYASGFAEAEGGKDLQQRLVEAAGEMAIVGPNCYGVLNLMEGVALWPDEHGAMPVERGVALITQSGNIGITLTMQERSLPIAAVLSAGNQAQLAAHDYIDVLVDDSRITTIGLYLEGIADSVELARVALKCAARGIPIVALKAGRSEQGAHTAQSHTSSLAGADAVIDAFFGRYGIVRVESLADLLETLKLLSVLGALPGRIIGSLSCSGGDAAMVADLALPVGLELPVLAEESRRTLDEELGPRVAIGNPLDYQTYIWGDPDRMRRCFAAMLGAGFDATLLVLDYPRPGENDIAAWDVATEALIDAARKTGARAIVASSLPETLPPHARERLMAAGIAPMQGLPEGLRAIAAAAWLGEAWRRMAESPPPPPLGPGRPPPEPVLLPESTAKSLLASFGLRVPEGEIMPIAEATTAARRIGFPVVLKTAADLAHKSEAGGIALSLGSEEEVAAAASDMARIGDHVLVERMLPPPLLEMIVGVDVDPQLGPHLVMGAGGRLVELWRDTALLLLPAAPSEVRAALRSLKVWPLLEGWRGGPAADLDAIVDAVCRIGACALAHADRLLELDVNPLMVYPAGQGAIAADALIRLAAPLERAEKAMEQVGMSEALKVVREGAILEVTLDRPKANAIDAPTSRAMGEVFSTFRDDPGLRVAIVTGAGERFFSAGWDLKAAADGEVPDADFGVGGFGGIQELPDLNKPVIAAVNGMAVGGGFELALSADLILAAEHARFALPEIKAGQLADAASIKLPRRIPHHVAMHLLLTGRWMDAEEAKRWGLVNEIVTADRLLARAREIAVLLANGPPLVFAALKQVIRETAHLPIPEAFDLVTKKRLPAVRALYESEDAKEGARAFAEKRGPVWRGR